jgi:hypothetical protein
MPEERRKPRFQFSLKKLLIWMAVVSVYCGIGNMIARWVRPQGYALQYLIALGLLIVLALVLRVVVPSGATAACDVADDRYTLRHCPVTR